MAEPLKKSKTIESCPVAISSIFLINSIGFGVSNTCTPSNRFFIKEAACRVVPNCCPSQRFSGVLPVWSQRYILRIIPLLSDLNLISPVEILSLRLSSDQRHPLVGGWIILPFGAVIV